MKRADKIAKLEREVIRCAMLRLRKWKRENPQGLVPFGHPNAIISKSGWNMVRACLELEKARAK